MENTTLGSHAGSLHGILEDHRLNSIRNHLPQFSFDHWFSLYRDHKRVVSACLECPGFSVLAPLKNMMGEFEKPLHPFNGPAFLTKLSSAMCQSKAATQTERKEGGFSLDAMPLEMFFLLSVSIPCKLRYHTDPGILMRSARLGKLDALDKLLRLDKAVVAEPRIARHIATYGLIPQSTEFKQIATALRGKPRKISIKRVKVLLGAFIYSVHQNSDSPLTYGQVQGLFDLSAQESGLGDVDTDLGSPEAFAKAIKRDIAFWSALTPGQKVN